MNNKNKEKNKVNPRIPSGFLELLPADQIQFNKMLDKIRAMYERFGFTPIETPALEFTEIILAKGGGETDKQVYRVNKEGDDLSLHFDLTVPLARYVAQHYENLTFPFRRYQIQKVWRGERKQRGRFREFYQCDIDVIGSDNIIIDAEIPSVIYSVFKELGFDDFTIRINNRKVLNGFLGELGLINSSKIVLRAVDKIEKQGEKAVKEELVENGISEENINKILRFIKITGSKAEIISQLKSLNVRNSLFTRGLDEIQAVSEYIKSFGVPDGYYEVDLTIARGLDYYTGTVYETVLNKYPEVGSVCSGGRFDDLAEYYTDKKLPGVGISIGLTRLFFKLKEAGLIKSGQATPTKVLIVRTKEEFLEKCLETATFLRQGGVNTEIYFQVEKMGKQFKYANQLGIPFVVVIGEEEVLQNKVSIKNMKSGEQKIISLDLVIPEIRK